MSDLVKCVDLFSICSESHESCVQINKTANHQIVLTDSGLLGAAELPAPNHVAVTAFYTEEDRKPCIFVILNENTVFVFCLERSIIPVMNVAFIIAYSDGHISHFAEVKMRVVLVIVRCDPAHPDTTGLLPRKHSHRIKVLVKKGNKQQYSFRQK